MSDRFANLTAACGGSISIESLTQFQKAMREYEVFMAGMSELLAPLDEPKKQPSSTPPGITIRMPLKD